MDAARREAARMGYAWGVGALVGLSSGGWNVLLRVHCHEGAAVSRVDLLQRHWGVLPSICFFVCLGLRVATFPSPR
jgi:hypothetical protein